MGFVEVNKDFDLCKLLVSSIVFIHTIITLFIEYINKNKDEMKIIHFARSYNLFVLSLLIIGLSHVGTGFGIFSFAMGLTNLFMAVFDCDYEYEQQVSWEKVPNNVVS